MDKSVKKVRINIPMVLTWTRIALIPLIVGVFMIPTSVLSMHSQNLLGCIFFIVAAVTDALDGFIARRYGMGTTLGAFLDPVADKLMVSAALIVLLAFGRVDMLVALVIIGREITVSALRDHCFFFDWRKLHLLSSTSLFIRLCHNSKHLMVIDQCLQCWYCELRCSHKYCFHLILPLPS